MWIYIAFIKNEATFTNVEQCPWWIVKWKKARCRRIGIASDPCAWKLHVYNVYVKQYAYVDVGCLWMNIVKLVAALWLGDQRGGYCSFWLYPPFYHLNFGQVHTLSVKLFKKVNITVNVSLGPRISGFKMKENYYDWLKNVYSKFIFLN